MALPSALWIFAYGSLIWRPGFPYEQRRAAWVEGFERRLDQGSPDHRGTPERLGRVATLVRAPGRQCLGVVYRIADKDAASILSALDVREKGGYDRVPLRAALRGAPAGDVDAITWIASPSNPYHLGPASFEAMAAQIRDAVGPSGRNVDYVRSLHQALLELGHEDAHVRAVIDALDARRDAQP